MGRKHAKRARRAKKYAAAALTRKWAPVVVDLEAKYAAHPRFYVGYGSNHNVLQMQARCATAMPVVGGVLPDKRLVFAGVLTVEPCKGRSTPVSIWHVEPGDIAALDRYEGYPRLYGKRYAHATVDGERVATFYYVLNDPYTEHPPSPFYYATVEEGFNEWGFDQEVLRTARAEAVAALKTFVAKGYECEVCGEFTTGAPLDGQFCICERCAAKLGYHDDYGPGDAYLDHAI